MARPTEYRRDGLCPRCGIQPKAAGKGYCVECQREYLKEYRKEYNARTKEKRTAWQRKYYAAHRDERLDRIRIYDATKFARERGFTIVEEVDLAKVYERDEGICHVCELLVDWNLDRRLDPEAATLDHLEPIHSYATVKLAHRRCNAAKEASTWL